MPAKPIPGAPCQCGCGELTKVYGSRVSRYVKDHSNRARAVPAEQRFWKYVRKTDTCWLWIGRRRCGYGQFNAYPKGVAAHRFAYELLVGPIPDGLEIDHICRNKACVNPDHLEPVTPKENVRRGNQGLLERKRTHCPRGHEYTPENTYVSPKGKRECRTCTAARHRRGRERKRAKRQAASS